ncbi:MinD-like ATPase involved in chromosome partitioning or flagellar assembly [Arcanobacterium pluranimalium]|uniref:cellulose synthase operon protein YhjQ/BcsQ n=1 Tax=Arcanobacterium pluranimalium TaxID=108028 RepID=UPI0019561A78|nr:cellulose synthase operon protein YhjQ/BcsQ [Arcanobacterium pluranimalium]MBM7824522.1 MinD-like ATPase involved in chromosome partitioning or flagellar assembly [Arcanobacterium pluranimalium]
MTDNSSNSSQTHIDLFSVVYIGNDTQTYEELRKLADLVGVDVVHVSRSDFGQGVLRFSSLGCDDGYVEASFHELFAPYFAKGTVRLNCRDDAADLLELMVAVGSTVRGRVVGVIGMQGGSGASTLSALIARTLARRENDIALVDMDCASVGIDMLLSQVGSPGKRWADIRGRGAVLAGRLRDCLIPWHGVSVLSADHRGGVPLDSDQGIKVISALAQVHSWTVLDLPSSVIAPTSPEATWLEWCDYIVLVTKSSDLAVEQTRIKLEQVGKGCPVAVVVSEARSKNHLAHIAQTIGSARVYNLRKQRNFAGDLEHGLAPGDRSRSGMVEDVKMLCDRFLLESDAA